MFVHERRMWPGLSKVMHCEKTTSGERCESKDGQHILALIGKRCPHNLTLPLLRPVNSINVATIIIANSVNSHIDREVRERCWITANRKQI